MGITPRPIGQDPQSKLLWEILKKIDQFMKIVSKKCDCCTTTTTTTLPN
jgi:hypothetical protein